MDKYVGALPDIRPQVEREKNFTHEEFFGLSFKPVEWIEKTNWKSYDRRDQDGSGACGPFAVEIALKRNHEIETGIVVNLDPSYIYNKRSNKTPGMYMDELLRLACTVGLPTDPAKTADKKNDIELASRTFGEHQIEEALKYRGLNWIYVRKDIEFLASLIEQGYTLIFLLRCQADEWTAKPVVLYPNKTYDFNINHFNPWLDFGIHTGDKVLANQDSWGIAYGENGLRFCTQAFIDKRVEAVAYIIDLPNSAPTDKPKYTFSNSLYFAKKKNWRGQIVYDMKMMNNPDVKALQDILKYEGLMDEKVISSGNFLEITRASVMKFQRKYQVASEADIVSANGAVGPLTRKKLNEIYA